MTPHSHTRARTSRGPRRETGGLAGAAIASNYVGFTHRGLHFSSPGGGGSRKALVIIRSLTPSQTDAHEMETKSHPISF